MGVAKKRKHKIGNRSTVCEFKYFQTLPVSNDVPIFSENKAQDSHDVSPIVFARAHIYGAVWTKLEVLPYRVRVSTSLGK